MLKHFCRVVEARHALSSTSLLVHLLLRAIATLALVALIRLAFSAAVSGPSLVEILLQPLQHQLTQLAVARVQALRLLGLDVHVVDAAPLLDPTQAHVHEVRRPRGEVVEDVGRVDDGARARLGLALQEVEEVAARQQVEVDCDFVEQQNRPRPQQAHGQLHPPPLAVRHGVHAPAQVDVEDLDEVVAALAVVVAADRGQQRRHVDVGAHDGVEHPLQAEVRHALEAHLERVDARDGHGA
jgi:hypothetical protein